MPHVAPGRKLIGVACVVLPAIGAAIVYSRFLDQYFFRDDTVWLTAASNPHFYGFLRDAFMLPQGPTPYWRPLDDLYFFAMYRIFGLDPMPYHLANLVFHAAAASLTVVLIRRLTGSVFAGALAGMLFVVAPAYGEGVIWISTVGASMATLFSLASIVFFLRYLDGKGNTGVLLLALAAFGLALLSLEASICLPPLLAVLTLAARPPGSAVERRRYVTGLLPFAALGLSYVAMLATSDYFNPSSAHALDWHAVPRLLDRLLWLSLPLSSTDYGSWVDGARWWALGAFTAAAGITLVRRLWIYPALFASAVMALVPSSFLDRTFQYRWVYIAGPFWAGFMAILAVALIRWLRSRHVLLAALAAVVVVASAAAALLPHDTDVQRRTALQAGQLEAIHDVLVRGCPDVGKGETVFILPLPFSTEPHVHTTNMVTLTRPGSAVVYVGAQALRLPAAGDCIVEWRSGSYAGTSGSAYTPGPFWTVSAAAGCSQAAPWGQARFYIDRLANVRGPVVKVGHVGNATVLQIGQADALYIIIPSKFRSAYPDPDQLFLGKAICVRGLVRYFNLLSVTISEVQAIYVE